MATDVLRYRLTGDQVERLTRPIVGQGGWQSLTRKVLDGLVDDVVSITERTRDRIVAYRERYGDDGGWQARLSFVDDAPLPSVVSAPPPTSSTPRRLVVRLLDVDVVARRLGVSRGYVARLIRRKSLTAIRVGRYWRVEPDAVDAFVERHRQRADDELAPVVDDRQLALFAPETDDDVALRLGFAKPDDERAAAGLSSSLAADDVPF